MDVDVNLLDLVMVRVVLARAERRRVAAFMFALGVSRGTM